MVQTVLDKAYLQDIQHQRYTREKSLERLRTGTWPTCRLPRLAPHRSGGC
jgi:hypothetical protein